MKTKSYAVLVLLVGCTSWASAAEPNYSKGYQVDKKVIRSANRPTKNDAIAMAPSTRGVKKSFNKHAGVIIGDNNFRAKARSHGQVWLGPISGEGVFLGPLGGDGVFSTLLDRMVTGQLSNVGKLDEDFNIVLTPGDLASMQGQALKTGDVEVLGLMIIMFRQLDDLFWWTVDGANF